MIAEKLATLGYREKIALGVGVLFIFAVLVDRLAVQYIAQLFEGIEADIQVKENYFGQKLLELRNERVVVREFTGLQKCIVEVPSAAAAIDRVKGDIDELAGGTGVGILSIKHRETRPTAFNEDCKEVMVEIEKYEAGMRELLTFLHRLHASQKLLKVERLTVSPQKDGRVMTGSMLIAKIVRVARRDNETAVPAKP